MHRNLIALMATAFLLIGCATPVPQYALPTGVPFASIKSSIKGANSHNESISVSISDLDAKPPVYGRLFAINYSKSKPLGYMQVPANVPLDLGYYESASGGRYCQLSAKVTLEQGKTYSLVGGFAYESGPIPILMGTRKCHFGVVDDATGIPVTLR
ncbi:MAG: hypothetical protein V4858_11300 [Pseudomonadota bacterium]